MKQLNLKMDKQFERDLNSLMRKSKIRFKAQAIRAAVREVLDRMNGEKGSTEFSQWIGMALRVPLNSKPRFNSEDDLWS